MNHDLVAAREALEIIELLTLYLLLLSEKNCLKSAAPREYCCGKDEFADHVRSTYGHALQLHRQLPVTTTLSAIRAGIERRGDKSVLSGEDYEQKALVRLTDQYLSTGDNKQ